MTSIRWAKILVSGSALEVTSITASGIDNNSSINGEALFASPDGILRSTSSIVRRTISISDPFNSLTELDTVLDINYSTYSITVPDLPVSVSFITNSIRSNPNTGIISSAMLFTDITGGLEYSSSYFVEPVLSYEGSQSATANNQMQFVLDPHTTATASLPYNIGGIGTSDGEIGIWSDKVSIFATSSAKNYIIWDSEGGRYIEPTRTAPSNLTATASFSIPFVFNFVNNPAANSVAVVYRLWEDEYEYDNDGFYDLANFSYSANDLGYTGTFPFSGSITGSFILNEDIPFFNGYPIFTQGSRYALHLSASDNATIHIGFDTASGDGTAGGTGQDPFKFEIEGQSEGVLNANIILGGTTSGSFLGEQFGNYSGSLSGITLNSTPLSQAVVRGNGITFNWGITTTDFWRGARPITASVILYNKGTGLTGNNKSGLQFETPDAPPDPFFENPISLTSSLAGNGLLFANGGSNISKINIGTSNGLTTETDGLKINSTAYGDGLEFTNNKISASLYPGYGLRMSLNKLRLTESLAGDGLEFPGSGFNKNYSILNIDNTYIVSPTQSLQMKAPGFAGGLGIGNIAGAAFGTALSSSYSSSTGQGEIYYQYWLDGHSTLEKITGNIILSSSDVNLGNNVNSTQVILHNSFSLASSNSLASEDNNFLTVNYDPLVITSPSELRRGGIHVIAGSSVFSGSLGWFHTPTNNSGDTIAVTFDGRTLKSGSWLLSTASFYEKNGYLTSQYNPFNKSTNLSSATASLDSSSAVAAVASILTGSTTNPNSLAEHLAFYSTGSISNYGAFYIRTEGTDPAGADSNVWVYITD